MNDMNRKRKETKSYCFHYSSSVDNKALSYSIVCNWLNSNNRTNLPPFDRNVLTDAKNQSIEVGDWATAEKILNHLSKNKEQGDVASRHRRATMPYALSALINQAHISEILSIGTKNKI